MRDVVAKHPRVSFGLGDSMSDDAPQGQRFSHVYLSKGELLPDSERMRRRLHHAFVKRSPDYLASIIEGELGVKVQRYNNYTGGALKWEQFFLKEELRDILDAVTLLCSHPDPKDRTVRASERWQRVVRLWIDDVRRIFAEERVSYRVDDQGGVHLAVDGEFERNRAATLAGLGSARYANVLERFEAAFYALDKVPPDGKAAIRAVFEANEGLFRLMFPKASVLKGDEINNHLRPRLNAIFEADRFALVAAQKMLTSFAEWITAAHQYRHEHGTEEPSQPPLGLAVMMVSLGASFIRWLIEIDQEPE
jgi:hypothetical protein